MNIGQVTFMGWTCYVQLTEYVDNRRPALWLMDKGTGEPVATASVNVPSVPLEADEVLIKDYSENVGMLKTLLDAGIVEDTGKRADTGFDQRAPIMRIVALKPKEEPVEHDA